MIDRTMSEGGKKISEEEREYQEVICSVGSGDDKARTKLAWYKLSGRGCADVDVEGAVVLLEGRVKDKDAEAMWMLGVCYEYGMGCEQDVERAEELYQQSRDSGSVISKFLAENGQDERGCGVMNVAECL